MNATSSLKTLSRPLAARVAGLSRLPQHSHPQAAAAPPLPARVQQAAIDALARGETHYTDRPGLPELRQWVADDLNRRWQLALEPQEVTITCGSTEARYVIITRLAEAGTAVLCPGDATPIRGALHLAGADLAKSPSAANIRLLYLPADWAAARRSECDDWLAQAQSEGWWVIWDLSFAPQMPDFHPAQNEKLRPRTVTVHSLSAHLPGWRLGWMAGSAAALSLRAGKQAITICTTNVSQWAGLEFLRSSAL